MSCHTSGDPCQVHHPMDAASEVWVAVQAYFDQAVAYEDPNGMLTWVDVSKAVAIGAICLVALRMLFGALLKPSVPRIRVETPKEALPGWKGVPIKTHSPEVRASSVCWPLSDARKRILLALASFSATIPPPAGSWITSPP